MESEKIVKFKVAEISYTEMDKKEESHWFRLYTTAI